MSYPGNNVQIEGYPENSVSEVSVDYKIVAEHGNIYAKRVDYKKKYEQEREKKTFWRCICATFCCLFCCFPC